LKKGESLQSKRRKRRKSAKETNHYGSANNFVDEEPLLHEVEEKSGEKATNNVYNQGSHRKSLTEPARHNAR